MRRSIWVFAACTCQLVPYAGYRHMPTCTLCWIPALANLYLMLVTGPNWKEMLETGTQQFSRSGSLSFCKGCSSKSSLCVGGVKLSIHSYFCKSRESIADGSFKIETVFYVSVCKRKLLQPYSSAETSTDTASVTPVVWKVGAEVWTQVLCQWIIRNLFTMIYSHVSRSWNGA